MIKSFTDRMAAVLKYGIVLQLKRMRSPLIILFLLTLALGFSPFYLENAQAINFCLSLCTCFLSALVLLFFVDFYLSEIDRKKSLDKESACFRTLTPAIYNICYMYFSLLKITSAHVGRGSMSAAEILKSIDFDVVGDIERPIVAPVYPERTWVDYFAGVHLDFADSISKFVEKYAVVLDAETIDLCELLTRNHIMSHCAHVKNHKVTFPSYAPFSEYPLFVLVTGKGFEGICPVKVFVKHLEALIGKVEAARGADLILEVYWEEHMAPALGEALNRS